MARLTRVVPRDGGGTYEYVQAVMSDGKVLQKCTIRVPGSDPIRDSWTVKGSLKSGVTAPQWVDAKTRAGWSPA